MDHRQWVPDLYDDRIPQDELNALAARALELDADIAVAEAQAVAAAARARLEQAAEQEKARRVSAITGPGEAQAGGSLAAYRASLSHHRHPQTDGTLCTCNAPYATSTVPGDHHHAHCALSMPPRCKRCGGREHATANCVRCAKCGNPGHDMWSCPQVSTHNLPQSLDPLDRLDCGPLAAVPSVPRRALSNVVDILGCVLVAVIALPVLGVVWVWRHAGAILGVVGVLCNVLAAIG